MPKTTAGATSVVYSMGILFFPSSVVESMRLHNGSRHAISYSRRRWCCYWTVRKGLIEPPDELEDCVYICIYPGEVFYFSSPFLGLSWRCTTTKHSEMNLKKNIFSTPQQLTFFNSFLYIPIAATFRPCFSAADINENTYSFIKEIETDTVSSAVLRYFFF